MKMMVCWPFKLVSRPKVKENFNILTIELIINLFIALLLYFFKEF